MAGGAQRPAGPLVLPARDRRVQDLALQAQVLPPGDPGRDRHQQQRHGQRVQVGLAFGHVPMLARQAGRGAIHAQLLRVGRSSCGHICGVIG